MWRKEGFHNVILVGEPVVPNRLMRGVKSLLIRAECGEWCGRGAAVTWHTEGTLVSVTAPLPMMDDHRRRHTDTRQI